MIANFWNTQFTVNEKTRLSVSSWVENGVYTQAVAITRKQARGVFAVDHETAIEFKSEDETDTQYRGSDYGIKLVTKELGYEPTRFYRDNAITRNYRKSRKTKGA